MHLIYVALKFTHCSDVRDIHDVLEVTVYDEDKDHKAWGIQTALPTFAIWDISYARNIEQPFVLH